MLPVLLWFEQQAAEFEEPETPSSLGADFEYFPAGQSQEAVPGDTDEVGFRLICEISVAHQAFLSMLAILQVGAFFLRPS